MGYNGTMLRKTGIIMLMPSSLHPFPFAHGETSALITHLSPAGAVKVKEGSAKIFTSCSGRSFLVAILPMRMMVRIPLMTLPMTQNFRRDMATPSG